MANVTDEDREFIRDNYWNHEAFQAIALYRERIEARKDAQFSAGRDKRIAELEKALSSWRDLGCEVTRFAEDSNDAGYQAGIRSFIAELEAERDALRGVDVDLSHAHARIADLELANSPRRAESLLQEARIKQLEQQLAAANPVLTADEFRTLDLVERNWPQLAPVIDVCKTLRRYVSPPPKAPPTDAELAKLALDMAERIATGASCDALRTIGDALRARGAK